VDHARRARYICFANRRVARMASASGSRSKLYKLPGSQPAPHWDAQRRARTRLRRDKCESLRKICKRVLSGEVVETACIQKIGAQATDRSHPLCRQRGVSEFRHRFWRRRQRGKSRGGYPVGSLCLSCARASRCRLCSVSRPIRAIRAAQLCWKELRET